MGKAGPLASAQACCGACRAHERAVGKRCAVAVFVTGSGECFLKSEAAAVVNRTGRVSCKPGPAAPVAIAGSPARPSGNQFVEMFT